MCSIVGLDRFPVRNSEMYVGEIEPPCALTRAASARVLIGRPPAGCSTPNSRDSFAANVRGCPTAAPSAAWSVASSSLS